MREQRLSSGNIGRPWPFSYRQKRNKPKQVVKINKVAMSKSCLPPRYGEASDICLRLEEVKECQGLIVCIQVANLDAFSLVH
jgi:hypothetical protein